MKKLLLTFLLLLSVTFTWNNAHADEIAADVEAMMNGINEVYKGDYAEGQNLLLAFDRNESFGVAIIRENNGEPVWVCFGELNENGITGENSFPFTIGEEDENGITIYLQGGQLRLKNGSFQELADFLYALLSGEYV